MTRVAVIGAGSWGTTFLAACANGPTVLRARRPALAREIDRERTNTAYLPGMELAASLRVTASVADAVDGADAMANHGAGDWDESTIRERGPALATLSPAS